MENNEIIHSLKVLRNRYINAVNSKLTDVSEFRLSLNKSKITIGFCICLSDMFPFGLSSVMIEELNRDRELDSEKFALRGFWYPVSVEKDTIEEIKATCLQPRLDNILRTIIRLAKQQDYAITY